MRSLETGRYMLRATNTGITAIIDATGTVRKRLPAFTEGALSGSAQGYVGATPYVRFGNWAVVILSLVLIALSTLNAGRRA
jgi:apolipoprotein N-acyltransferase